MQSAYSGVNALALAAVLLSLALCLQGCGEEGSTPKPVEVEGFCAEGVIETYGEVTGKILRADYGKAVVECNEGLTYQGPELECADIAKVCPLVTSATSQCFDTPGFIKTTLETTLVLPQKDIKGDEEALKAESKLLAQVAETALVKDGEVVCTNWPPSKFQTFAELPLEQQTAAKALGFDTAEKWDTHEKNPTDNQNWAELSEPHQAAATTLGWTTVLWDEELGARKTYIEKLEAEKLAKAAAEADAGKTPKEVEKEAKEDATKEVAAEENEQTQDWAVQRINAGGGLFTPMGVSFVLCMCLVLAVSIRAVTRYRQQSRSVDLIEADPELLEAEDIPE